MLNKTSNIQIIIAINAIIIEIIAKPFDSFFFNETVAKIIAIKLNAQLTCFIVTKANDKRLNKKANIANPEGLLLLEGNLNGSFETLFLLVFPAEDDLLLFFFLGMFFLLYMNMFFIFISYTADPFGEHIVKDTRQYIKYNREYPYYQ